MDGPETLGRQVAKTLNVPAICDRCTRFIALPTPDLITRLRADMSLSDMRQYVRLGACGAAPVRSKPAPTGASAEPRRSGKVFPNRMSDLET